MRVTVSNFSKSVKWLRRYCDFTVFQNGGRRHLGFSKIQILRAGTVHRPNLHHCVKFRQDRPIRC